MDFSLFLVGPSGVFKTEIAALCQQHFGARMHARNLPGHFGSTASALQELTSLVKDALLVVDDFVPIRGSNESEVRETAERLSSVRQAIDRVVRG